MKLPHLELDVRGPMHTMPEKIGSTLKTYQCLLSTLLREISKRDNNRSLWICAGEIT